MHRELPLVLGAACEPWQPSEAKALATRAALDVASRLAPLDVRASTRSTLIVRDADLLAAIARRGRVQIGFSIPTLDRRLAKLLEPLAPTPDRRLFAMEALARARISVGLVASPLVPGLSDALPALDGLLARAKAAGASWASAAPLEMSAPFREKLLRFTAHFDDSLARRYERLLGSAKGPDRAQDDALQRRFRSACERRGLAVLDADEFPVLSSLPGTRAPLQLSLF